MRSLMACYEITRRRAADHFLDGIRAAIGAWGEALSQPGGSAGWQGIRQNTP
jgi:hypothetical protein